MTPLARARDERYVIDEGRRDERAGDWKERPGDVQQPRLIVLNPVRALPVSSLAGLAALTVQQTTQISQTLSPPRQRRRQHHDSEMRSLRDNDNHAGRVTSQSQTALRSCVSHVAAVRPPSTRG